MAEHDLIRRGTEEEMTAMEAQILSEEEKHALNISQLRKKAGLTLREARAYLCDNWESQEGLAIEWLVCVYTIQELMEKAAKKIKDTSLTDKDIFGDHPPETVFVTPDFETYNELVRSGKIIEKCPPDE